MTHTPFIGRKEDLKDLRFLLEKKSASLTVIRGRRRIGKSRLIKKFSKRLIFIRFISLTPTTNRHNSAV